MAKPSTTDRAYIAQFLQSADVNSLPEHTQGETFLVPNIVKATGQLIGLRADALWANWDEQTEHAEIVDAYREIAVNTAHLLDWFSVTEIDEGIQASVEHRLAAQMDPLVALHARVDHLFRAYQGAEVETIRDDAQKLWAVLAFRCPTITGVSFAEVLRSV